MSSLNIRERVERGTIVVDLEGSITIGETNRKLHDAMRQLVIEQKKDVLLNLAKVKYIDSSGLGEVVAGFSTLKAAGGVLKLANVPERVMDLMTMTKLYTVFDIYDNESEALDSFAPAENSATQTVDASAAASSIL